VTLRGILLLLLLLPLLLALLQRAGFTMERLEL
jgi:hypothetical protein